MIKRITNKVVKLSSFYQNQFADCSKFWNLSTFNLEAVNLGSNSGKYAFDYTDIPIKADNWAMGPQQLALDFAILQNYFSYLAEVATVIIPLCPFSCIARFQPALFKDKYYTILHHASIPGYSNEKKLHIHRLKNSPGSMLPTKKLIKALLKTPVSLLKQAVITPYYNRNRNPLTEDLLKVDALKWITGWKKEFDIKNLSDPLSEFNKEAFMQSVDILREIIDFCIERNLKPILIIPPVTKYIAEYFTPEIKERFIYSFVRQANTNNVAFLDYFTDERFQEPALYFNSFFLNLRGRKLFTRHVLRDLGLIE
jgi:hypothetical protein